MGLNNVHFPFLPDSEDEILLSMASYFLELGFTLQEMSLQDSFKIKIGHTSIAINSRTKNNSTVRGRSDLLLLRDKLPLAIIETKAPNIELTDRDRDQGLSYARLLLNMPPFTIITNGKELRVYDTITTDLIKSGTPSSATWVLNGMKHQGANEEMRRWAVHTLFSLDFDALKAFCNEQTRGRIADLKSTPDDVRYYDPDLYVSRSSLRQSFEAFISSSFLCFAITGDSGIGKTNELCALAESISDNNRGVVLFYRATDLANGLTGAIASDFVWGFLKDEPIARIIHRFCEIVATHHSTLYIFVDGLDEYPGQLSTLRAELNEFTRRLNSTNTRLCVSCKTTDWSEFIGERNITLNQFGRNTYPKVERGDLPGIPLQVFNEHELDEAWSKYRSRFHIHGSLSGETRNECSMPQILRFVAEVYRGKESIPTDLSDKQVFDHYWSYKMAVFDKQRRLIAELIICKASEMMIRLDLLELNELEFYKELSQIAEFSTAYNDTLRYGLLRRRGDHNGNSYLTFPFGKLRAYVFTVKARNWPSVLDKAHRVKEIRYVTSTRLGKDALFFYTSVAGINDSEEWFIDLIDVDLPLFISTVKSLSNKANNLPGKLQNRKIKQHDVERFIKAYSALRDQFPNIKMRIPPYTLGKAGLWITDNIHGYRTTTEEYPQPILFVPGEVITDLDAIGQQQIKPGGNVSNQLANLSRANLPEWVALSEINTQIANLVGHWLLNESNCPTLVIERTHNFLREHSTSWANTPSGYYWDFLGYESLESAQTSFYEELLQRIEVLQQTWLDAFEASNESQRRWYVRQRNVLSTFQWLISQDTISLQRLPPPSFSPHKLFSDIYQDKEFQFTLQLIQTILPEIISNYIRLVADNFGVLASTLPFYQQRNARLIVEISQMDHSDSLLLTYTLLPSAPPGPPIVRQVSRKDSMGDKFVHHRSSLGSLFAENIEVSTIVDDHLINEPHAIISRTEFPDHHIITDQVYQLVQNEAQYAFGDRYDWNSHVTSHDRNKFALELLSSIHEVQTESWSFRITKLIING